jgi:zinc transport system substrate-binding protein
MRIVLILLSAVALAGCAGGDEQAAGAEGQKVVASFYPLAFLAEQVAGDGATVENLTPPGVEPHDLELPPRDVASLDDADLVLYLGGGFQPAVEDAIEQSGVHAVDVLPADADDPHLWLDPARFADVARRVSVALTGSAAAAAPTVARLEELDAEYRAGLADCERRELVVAHEAFGYLADGYGLEQVALAGLSPEAEAAPRDLARAVELIEDRGVTTVFVELLAPPEEIETVAREAGVDVQTLDPIEGLTGDEAERGEDYFTLMRANLAKLREALGCL